ncbi:MAG: BglII/BstYI family type II restriction endonuclease [Romboutsia timonensis]|uniref:BglII/BstYI family type II restriction endonuclease n=1 Tax=Romboutsia timonensis TaxID=1776391 RepID=UPI002A75B8BC|nr:BglII/BstYI family type II restriction endonuclease [Romboutsia timonensis]MDY2883437.1 BglII/BstYI family type II restriction endonuclease [Romboutsia timonensis]
MAIDLLPQDIRDNYEIFEWNYATSILYCDFRQEFDEIINILRNFRLRREDILANGGRKSPIAESIDSQFYNLNWEEKWFNVNIDVDGNSVLIPTHGVDCFKNSIAVEVEWNNKDPFFDRDLNNFRLLFDLNAISVGVIITRCTSLQEIFKRLGKGSSYGTSTTHMNKLLPRIESNGAGGCPVLAFGISENLYVE